LVPRLARSARDQRGGSELVKGRPGRGCVAVPSGGGVKAQARLATDPCEPVVNVTRCRGPRVIRREEQRLGVVGVVGVVGAGGATRERLCGQERPERRRDSVTAREARVDPRSDASVSPAIWSGFAGCGRERAGRGEVRLGAAGQHRRGRVGRGRAGMALVISRERVRVDLEQGPVEQGRGLRAAQRRGPRFRSCR
jgi:hypothetical protein